MIKLRKSGYSNSHKLFLYHLSLLSNCYFPAERNSFVDCRLGNSTSFLIMNFALFYFFCEHILMFCYRHWRNIPASDEWHVPSRLIGILKLFHSHRSTGSGTTLKFCDGQFFNDVVASWMVGTVFRRLTFVSWGLPPIQIFRGVFIPLRHFLFWISFATLAYA